jgi:hypothetical protein
MHLPEPEHLGHRVQRRERHRVFDAFRVLARGEHRQPVALLQPPLAVVPVVKALEHVGGVRLEHGLAEPEELEQAHYAGQDAEGGQQLLHRGPLQVLLELLVGARLGAERAHELDDRAVYQRDLHLGRVVRALGEGGAAVGACQARGVSAGAGGRAAEGGRRRAGAQMMCVSLCGVFSL